MTHPAALLGLLLLPLYWWLRRQEAQPRRRWVSSLLLWAEIPTRHPDPVAQWRRRWTWRMALELTALAGIVIALAGPRVRRETPRADQVVYVDRSASLSARDDGGTRWDRLRTAAQGWLRTRPEHESYHLLTGLGEVRGPLDRSGIEAALAAIVPLGRSESLADGVAAAWSLARARGGGPPLIVTDQPVLDRDARWLARGGTADNAGLVELCARKDGDALELLVGVQATSVRTVQLFVGTGAPTAVEAGPERVTEVLLRLPWSSAFAGERLDVRIDPPDGMLHDNTAWLTQPAPAAEVWQVGPECAALTRALDAVFSGRVRRVERLPDSPAATRRLVVFDRVAPERLPEAPCVLIAPPTDAPGLFAIGGTIHDPTRLHRPEFADALPAHSHLDTVRIRAARELHLHEPARWHVLLAAEQLPLMAWSRREPEGWPVLVIAFALDATGGAADSDWPQLPGFPIFFANLARAWQLADPNPTPVLKPLRPGDRVALPPGVWTSSPGPTPAREFFQPTAAGIVSFTGPNAARWEVATSLLASVETLAPGADVDPAPQSDDGDARTVEHPLWRWPLGLAWLALATAWALGRGTRRARPSEMPRPGSLDRHGPSG